MKAVREFLELNDLDVNMEDLITPAAQAGGELNENPIVAETEQVAAQMGR